MGDIFWGVFGVVVGVAMIAARRTLATQMQLGLERLWNTRSGSSWGYEVLWAIGGLMFMAFGVAWIVGGVMG